jgi:hypothetical protein
MKRYDADRNFHDSSQTFLFSFEIPPEKFYRRHRCSEFS